MQRRVLTMAEVSAQLGIPIDTLRYWRWRGEGIPSYKLGRRVVYDVDVVEAYIAERRRVGGAA
jgi:DNA-binding transcriptional MerR regulator